MSAEVLSKVLAADIRPATHKFVLAVLGDACDYDDATSVRVDYVARVCSMETVEAREVLRDLYVRGHLVAGAEPDENGEARYYVRPVPMAPEWSAL